MSVEDAYILFTEERLSRIFFPQIALICYGAWNLITLLAFTYIAWLTKLLIAIKLFKSLKMQLLGFSQWSLAAANSKLIRSCTSWILILNVFSINLIEPALCFFLQWQSQESEGHSCLSHHTSMDGRNQTWFFHLISQAEPVFFTLRFLFEWLLFDPGHVIWELYGGGVWGGCSELSRWIPGVQWLTSP